MQVCHPGLVTMVPKIHLSAGEGPGAGSQNDWWTEGIYLQGKVKELSLQSLEERRQEDDLLLAYKVLHGICPVDA